MRKILLICLLLAITFISCKTSRMSASEKRTADKVAAWQIQHYSDTVAPQAGWVYATLYRGMAEWAIQTHSQSIFDFLVKTGQELDWGMLPRLYDADDLCIGQTYFRLYDVYKDRKMIEKVIKRVDSVITHPDTLPLITAKGKYYRNRWGWCDALFMAPPVYARMYQLTGNPVYLDFCYSEYKTTTDSLYDPQKHLFYRDLRLVNDRDHKQEKVFWGRGNGWVYASLVLMLETVPSNHESYEFYLQLFRQMTRSIIQTQDKTGAWHSSLFDPETFSQPENSASGFFVYGLAFGINKGLLTDKEAKSALRKGWKSLQRYVNQNGKLGFVQPIGHEPLQLNEEMTMPYGAGAYLLAAAEMTKLLKKKRRLH